MFGLTALLGFDYRPQLADLPDAKLWRIDPCADYGPLNPSARGRIDLGWIEAHWPDILRVVASVHTGTVTAHDVIRVLSRGGNLTQLGEAIAPVPATEALMGTALAGAATIATWFVHRRQ